MLYLEKYDFIVIWSNNIWQYGSYSFFLGHMMAGSRLGPRAGGQRHRGGNEAQGHLIYYPWFCLAAFLTSLILTLLEISTDYFLWKVFTA